MSHRYDSSRSDEHEYLNASKFRTSGVLPIIGLEFLVDRSVVEKRFAMKALIGAVVVMGMALEAHAATAGQWRSDYRVQINGQDSQVIMKALDTQIKATMPTQLKSGAKTGLSAIGNQGSAGVCVTPQVATSWNSALGIFNTFASMNSRCKLVAGAATVNSLKFTGRCDDPNSFTGNVSGTVNMPNSWQWGVVMEGVGKFPAAVLSVLKLPANTSVPMKTTAWSSLLSKTCQ